MKLTLPDYFAIAKNTFKNFGEDAPMNSAAIISYYTVFSLPALLIIILRLAGVFLGEEAVSGQLFGQIKGIVGAQTAADIQGMVRASVKSSNGVVATAVGLATLALSATTIFVSLQEALNNVWHVKAKPEKGWLRYLTNRVLSISIVGVVAFLLLVSLSAEAILNVLSDMIRRLFGQEAVLLITGIDILLSLTLITGLFAIIFKYLPDAQVRWRNVWMGAFVTTILFGVGRGVIAWYLSYSNSSSAYGAAGSVTLIMLWVYYSATILLLGAEFTRAYSEYQGQMILPSAHAVQVEVKEVKSAEFRTKMPGRKDVVIHK
jgi:membrane protein